jgi:hypothetical protein
MVSENLGIDFDHGIKSYKEFFLKNATVEKNRKLDSYESFVLIFAAPAAPLLP